MKHQPTTKQMEVEERNNYVFSIRVEMNVNIFKFVV